MIMAGRGRRLDVEDKPKSADDGAPGPNSEKEDISTLREKINQLNLGGTTPPNFMGIRNLFNQLCSSKETMRDVLSDLHRKALSEADFCQKLILVIEQISDMEINGALVRGELLTLIQSDFEAKDTMSKNDPKKFINAVNLLGGTYNKIKICGAPIAVLGLALLDIFELLLEGGEEELKTLTKQLLLNGNTLSEAPTYDHFKRKLRESLLKETLCTKMKCWILLIMDLIANDLKPLRGPVNDFYISNLKDSYTKLDSSTPTVTIECKVFPQKKLEESTSPKQKDTKPDFKNTSFHKKGPKKFFDLPIKSEGANFNFKNKKDKNQISPGKNFKENNWKRTRDKESSSFEHDDRFIKEENFYGVQPPRQPKSENKKP